MKTRSNLVSRAVFASLGIFGAASASLANPPHWANAQSRPARGHSEIEYARVVDVDPIVRRIRVSTPDRECWNETEQMYPPAPKSSAAPIIIGSLIGGVVGHQFAHGHQRGPTVAGAVVGAAIGNQVGKQQAAARVGQAAPIERTVERCNVVYRDQYEERIDGYRVTYVYNGREYTTRMPYDPGKRIRVDVSVRPEY